MQLPNPLSVFGGKKQEKSDPQAKAASTHQQAAFEAVLNHADERDNGSARSTLGQLKQVEAIDLQQHEKQLVMKQINDKLQNSEAAGKPALAAATPANVLSAQMMKASA
jgi:hypothetical protein